MAEVVANRDVPRNVDDLGSRLEKSPRKIVRFHAQALLQRERLLRCDGHTAADGVTENQVVLWEACELLVPALPTSKHSRRVCRTIRRREPGGQACSELHLAQELSKAR